MTTNPSAFASLRPRLLLGLLACFALGLVSAWGQTDTSTPACGNSNKGGPTAENEPTKKDPLAVYTGNDYRAVEDLVLWGSVGPEPLAWTRRSFSRLPGGSRYFGHGHGWRHGFQWEIYRSSSLDNGRAKLFINFPDGASHYFVQTSPTEWAPLDGAKARIVKDGTLWKLCLADSSAVYFSENSWGGVARKIADAQGNITTFEYNPQLQLVKITEPAGRWLRVNYASLPTTKSDFQKMAEITATPASGWNEIILSPTTPYRYLRYLGPDGGYANVADIEFYAVGETAPLTGRLLGSESADAASGPAQAFDGDAATAFAACQKTGGFVGLDLGEGNAKSIARIRYRPRPGFEARMTRPLSWTSGGQFQGANESAQTATVIASVESSDGRRVDYAYTTFTEPTFPYDWPVLQSVDYHDGNPATFTYQQVFPGTRPLVVASDEPRSGLPMARQRLVYHDAMGSALGAVREQRSWSQQRLLSLGAYQGYSYHQPAVYYPDGTTEVHTMTSGLLAQTTDRVGRVTTFAYDTYGALASTTDPLGRTTRRVNTPLGNPLELTHPDGATERWTRDDADRPLTHTDPLGRVTRWERDARGLVTRITHPDGTSESYAYNALGQITTHTLPDLAAVSYTYDARGLLTSRRDAAGAETRYAYDPHDRLAVLTDALGRVTTYTYDTAGRLAQITYPDATAQSFAYDAYGNLVAQTDPTGAVTRHEYNEFNRRTATTDPLGRTTRYDYDPSSYDNRVLAQTSPSGQRTTWTYDATGRPLTQTQAAGTPDAATTRYDYNAGNPPVKITDPAGAQAQLEYDARDRLIKVSDPLQRQTQLSYDSVGNLVSRRDPMGHVDSFTYDARNRLLRQINANNQTISYGYDTSGRLQTLTDARNAVTTWRYNAMGQLLSKTYPDGTQEQYTYDAAGRLTSQRNANGQTCSLTYDNRDREISRVWSDATPAIQRTYDAAGRLLALTTDGVATHTYAYDAAGQLLSETTRLNALAENQFSVGYQYDADGRRARLTYPDGGQVNTTYTSLGQIAAISSDGPPPLATFAYDVAGRRTRKSLENGTTTAYSYDAVSQITGLVHSNSAGDLARFAYTYDLAGRRTGKAITGGTAVARAEAYGYDAIAQVTSTNYGAAGQESFAYDPMGNRTATDRIANGASERTTYTSNTLNQYTAVGTKIPAYDANGNTLALGERTFAYDGQNRLTSATLGGQPAGTHHAASFVYDGHNRQVSRTVDGQTTFFIWDGWSLLAEYQVQGGSPVLVTRYVHGPRQDEIILQQKTNQPTTAYLHEDALGSTYLLTDATGAPVESYSYTAFGEVTAYNMNGGTVASPATRFLYTGREWIAELGINDHRNRFYLPSLGHWLSRDPVGNPTLRMIVDMPAFNVDRNYARVLSSEQPAEILQGPNLYSYVGNNSVNLADPFGLWYIDINVSFSAGLAVTGGVFLGPDGLHPYLGGGVMTPGPSVSVMWSPGSPSPCEGSWQLSGGFVVGGAGGTDLSGNGFGEVGLTTPGFGLTGYYTW